MCTLGLINDRASLQIQCLLICIEMLLASIAHFYIFPYNEWYRLPILRYSLFTKVFRNRQDDYKREREKGILLRDTLALRDFLTDMRLMVTTWETHTPNNLPDSSPKMPARVSIERSHDEEKSAVTMLGIHQSDFSDEIQEEISSAMDIASLSLSALSAETDFQPSSSAHHDESYGAPQTNSSLTEENKESSEDVPLLLRRWANPEYDAFEEV